MVKIVASARLASRKDRLAIQDILDGISRKNGVPDWHAAPYSVIACDNQNHFIGGVWGYTTTWGECSIEVLAITDDHRRRGIGRQLIDGVKDIARERGCHKIEVGTRSFHRATRFYEKLGFERDKAETGFLLGEIAYKFVMRLDA